MAASLSCCAGGSRWDTPRTTPGSQGTVAGTRRIDAADPTPRTDDRYDGIAPVDDGSHLNGAPHLDAE
ncbi:MAG: hypothetical protein QOC63_1375 [Mycobacterium sp.]|jgi:hypothetical protein|nr:hypothetical protein [Mycobacterium sp.]